MTRMTNLIALLAVLACSPVLTADAQEPSLKAGDYTLKMNIKEMGERQAEQVCQSDDQGG